jgi:TonB family protein
MISLHFRGEVADVAVEALMGGMGTQWEGQVINGTYPLRRFLNASDHSAVYLTESATDGFFNAAIKLVPADASTADLQLWHWKTAATFSHPHLIRLLESGQCEIEGQRLLFVVMEYAEENLSQILPYRPLESDEARELLVPTLDALAFLHRESWVQGQLKPSNFLVVNDQLKLAIDTIRPVGVARDQVTEPSIYDPPEADHGEISFASDVWALGVSLVEALTQYPPTWPNGRLAPPSLPAKLPPTFVDIVQRCLSVNPADRPTIADLQLQTKPPAAVQPSATPAPATPAAVAPTAAREPAARQPALSAPARELPMRADLRAAPQSYSSNFEPEERRFGAPAIVAIVVVVAALWGGWRMFHRTSTAVGPTPAGQSSSDSAAQPTPIVPPPRPDASAPPPPAARSSSEVSRPPSVSPRPAPARTGPHSLDNSLVVHEEIPKASQSARQTIHGHIRVAVRVTVDASGKVVQGTFENASSSKYFNRIASDAARKWKFAPAESESSRQWLLHFEFGREGTTVRATRSRS